MSVTVSEQLPLLAAAPNGIKKLRELILELAVRGKLVAQDPNDEPASELLKRIAAEKKRLVAEGEVKPPKPHAKISKEDKPFALPAGWEWQRFGEVLSLEYGDNLPAGKRSNTGEYPVYGSNGVVGTHNSCFVEAQCIIVGRKGSAGALNLCLAEGCCVTDVAYYCIPSPEFSLAYVFKMFHTLGLDSLGKGIKPGLSRNEVYELVIAIPPLAEQHRIVAKVDELMALCDRLEAQQADAESAHMQLVATLLDSLARASDSDDFADSWQRLSAHFHTLFTTESSIDALKQALLQLAVMGKLVPQDPNDESASVWITRIGEDKTRLTEVGLSKVNEKSSNGVGREEVALPDSWQWTTLGELIFGMSSGWSPACESFPSHADDVWGVLKTTAVQVLSYLPEENKKLPPHLDPRPDAEVKTGDILFTRAGPANRVGISCFVEATRPRLMISDKIIRFHPVEAGAYGRYIALCLNAGETAQYLEAAKSGMAASQVNISQEKLKLAPIPMAPLPEQRRIIGKVDQLMDLCDQLKLRLKQARQLNEQFATALVQRAAA